MFRAALQRQRDVSEESLVRAAEQRGAGDVAVNLLQAGVNPCNPRSLRSRCFAIGLHCFEDMVCRNDIVC